MVMSRIYGKYSYGSGLDWAEFLWQLVGLVRIPLIGDAIGQTEFQNSLRLG